MAKYPWGGIPNRGQGVRTVRRPGNDQVDARMPPGETLDSPALFTVPETAALLRTSPKASRSTSWPRAASSPAAFGSAVGCCSGGTAREDTRRPKSTALGKMSTRVTVPGPGGELWCGQSPC